jgi:chromate reductase, NAD(P)H dehydrogenase (quinone)
MPNKIKVLAFSGSLRKDSYNSSLLRAAIELKPENMEIEIFDIGGIPLYSDDLKTEGFPEKIKSFAEKISSADGILIATPEYNYSIPGVLKNAIDWISRMAPQPFNEKPAAIFGASPGMLGTVRAQIHLRQIAVFVNLIVMNKPEVYVNFAKDKFDLNGNLTDEKTREVISKFLTSFNNWIGKISKEF